MGQVYKKTNFNNLKQKNKHKKEKIMSVNQINKTVKPLSNDELFKVAPSIFSEM